MELREKRGIGSARHWMNGNKKPGAVAVLRAQISFVAKHRAPASSWVTFKITTLHRSRK